MGLRLLSRAPKGILFALALTASAAFAVEDRVRHLSGTTFADGGKEYAYLQWTSPDPLTLGDAAFAIYAKPGAPSSPAPFTVVGTLQLQTNPTILDAILADLPATVFEPNDANTLVDEMFGSVMPAGPLTLGTKLSVVLRDAQANPESLRTLALLARTEPFIGACLGTAVVAELPADLATFEFRSRTAPGGAFDVIAGRVTLDHSSPPAIPAPPLPRQLFENKPSDHLNVKLNWNITNALARSTPLTYGYNVYRLTRGFTEGGGYDTTPPTAAQLAAAISVFPNSAKQVNALPILPQDGVDMPFLVDDNGVNFGEGDPLLDGDEYYYFAAARDILGRPGALSPGLLVQICDRMPPGQPVDVHATDKRVYNKATDTATTRLQVAWEPSPNGDEPTGGYYVYRWASQAELVADAGSDTPTATPVSPLIPHVNGLATYTWVDDSAGAPNPETSARQTAWYSVRAVDDTACGELESGDSAPGWGVPRDFEGPPAGGASITFSQTCPEFDWQQTIAVPLTTANDIGFTGPTGDVMHYQFKAERLNSAIDKIEWGFSYIDVGGSEERVNIPIGQGRFTQNTNALIFKRRIPRVYEQDAYFADFLFRVTDTSGKQVSARVAISQAKPDAQLIMELCTRIDMITSETTIDSGGTGPEVAPSLDPNRLDGQLNPPTIGFVIPPTAEEYKLYKRIDGGPLLLVEQKAGVAPSSIEEVVDTALPANAAKLCYFVQYYNADGSPSPLSKIGCVTTNSRAPLPTPILAEVESAGSAASPQAVLRWFCPREGVGHFRVSISDGKTQIISDYSPDLEPYEATYPASLIPAGGGVFEQRTLTAPSAGEVVADTTFYPYSTPRIGPAFGDDAAPAEFSLTLDLAAGREYHFYVRAIGKYSSSDRGTPSETVDFTWSAPVGNLTQVPWPARTLPPVDPSFLPQVESEFIIGENFTGGAIKVGSIHGSINQIGSISRPGFEGLLQSPTKIPSDSTIELYSTLAGETVFPCVVYRVQVPNALFPTVSGDVVQVTPMLEYIRTMESSDGSELEIWDPFVNVKTNILFNEPQLYIFDTQGIVFGANYKYLLVRFKDNGEIDRVIPAGTIITPDTP